MQCSGEKAGGQVFVDDAFYARQISCLIPHHGDAASANGHDNETALNQDFYGVALDDLLRLRRCHNATPATTGVLGHDPTFLGHLYLRILLIIEGADRFAGMLQGRVVAINEHLGDDGDTLTLNVAA